MPALNLTPSTGPILPRLVNALRLRREFYDAVAADRRATGAAGGIVCLAAVARESIGLYQVSQSYKGWGLILALIVVFALVRWVVYATVMYPLARAIGGGPVDYRRLLRCLGFAETPAMLTLLGFLVDDRFFTWVQFGVGAWLLAATVVAVRSATATSTGRAVAIGVAGFATYLLLGVAIDYATQLPASAPDAAAVTLTLRAGV